MDSLPPFTTIFYLVTVRKAADFKKHSLWLFLFSLKVGFFVADFRCFRENHSIDDSIVLPFLKQLPLFVFPSLLFNP